MLSLRTDEAAVAESGPKLYSIYLALFVTCLLVSNIIAVKLIALGPIILPAAVFLFPITYIFGDVLTEVYGYAGSRRIIWLGFAANLVLVASIILAIVLPAAGFWKQQDAFVAILGLVPRIVVSSIMGYWAGEFLNSYVLAKMKVWMKKWDPQDRWLILRTVGSTVVGEGADSIIFIIGAFAFTMPWVSLLVMIFWQWLFKVVIEFAMTPVTYIVVRGTKAAEGLDVTGASTYTPFKW